MIFTSLLYLLFLVLAWGITYTLHPRLRVLFLLLASYGFYMAWKPKYVLIIIALTVADYFFAMWIENAKGDSRKKFFWISSVVANMGMLFAFKYLGFFTAEINRLLAWMQTGGAIPVIDLLLPIGISFHTFQAVSYTTDVYLGHQKAQRNFPQFALFIAWFPQMIAGPIERASTLLVQLDRISFPMRSQVISGLGLFVLGYFKKVVIADRLAYFVDPVFASPEQASAMTMLLAVYGFALQIYFDFSSYTDIAKGSSLFFGVRLSENFQAPYLSLSLPEFWKRWHMSLSSWFFEYVYFPFVRKFQGAWVPYAGILTVFVLSGIWHGANWTFLVWGFANAVIYLGYLAYFRVFDVARSGPGRFVMMFVNFHLVCFCWIFFRSPSLETAGLFLKRIPTLFTSSSPGHHEFIFSYGYQLLLALIGLAAFAMVIRPLNRVITEGAGWAKLVAIALFFVIGISVLGVFESQSFIYFQF